MKNYYELSPVYDARQSFYRKACVHDTPARLELGSYETTVASIDKKTGKATVNDLYSATTTRHIKEFLRQNGCKAETAKQIMKDYGRG